MIIKDLKMRVKRFTRYLPHFFAEIRLIKMGCRNRPFYHLGVLPHPKPEERYPDEILGSYDPMLNERNEKLLSINLERLAFWLGEGAKPTKEVSHLLGKCEHVMESAFSLSLSLKT